MTAQSQSSPSSKARSTYPVVLKGPESATTTPETTMSATSARWEQADESETKVGTVPALRLLMLNNFESAVNVLDNSSGALTEMNSVDTTNDKDLMKQQSMTIDSSDDDSDDNGTVGESVDDAASAHLGDPEENEAIFGNNAGVALFQLGRLEGGLYSLERSVQVVETILSQEKQQRQDRRKNKKENNPTTAKQESLYTPKSKEWVHQRRRDYGVMLHNLGVAQYQMGRHEVAIKSLRRAKKVLHSGKNRGEDVLGLLAATLYQLGLVCSSKGCFPDAWEAFDESWRLLDNNKKRETIDSHRRRRRRQELLRDKMDKIEDMLANNMKLSFDFS